MSQHKAFIETDKFPAALVSQVSGKEKIGGGRPDYWEMIFWWTRKPLSSARAVIAGCLLPEDTERTRFVKSLGLDKKVPHRYNPIVPREWQEHFLGKKLLDPFSGFGSIPLEALRLGLSTTAVELLPTAYTFLQAVLEYPLKYGSQLTKDVEKWGNRISDQLRTDSVIRQLYDDDVLVYINSWEIKCPHCSKWTPLVGNYWLARVRASKSGYERLAWFEPRKEDSGISLAIVDLNKQYRKLEDAVVNGQKITIGDRTFTVPGGNINSRSEQATCLNCNSPIRYIDIHTKKHYLEKKKLPSEILKGLEWYVKFCIRAHASGDQSLVRQRLLVKVRFKGTDTEFVPCTAADQEKLTLAAHEIDQLGRDADIPTETFAPYGHSEAGQLSIPTWGFDRLYKLFNHRQLLTLVKLVKLIRENGKAIETELLSQGKGKQQAIEYAGAVVTYLGIALCKYAQYSSLTTGWNASFWSPVKIRDTMSFRGISMTWNSSDANPIIHGSPVSLEGMLKYNLRGLKYLVSALSAFPAALMPPHLQTEAKVRILLDDATVLRSLDPNEKFDLVITDPPYYGDVAYTELSDFYYVWLKRALSDVDDGRLVPKYSGAFFKKMDHQSVETITQWEAYALREVSLNSARLGEESSYEEGVKHFQDLLDASFLTIHSLLKENGILVTYYAHTDPEAWKALLRSGWEYSGLTVSNAFPITTESSQSIMKRGKLSLDTSIVVVWRTGASGSIHASTLYDQMIVASRTRVQSAVEMKIRGRDLFLGALAAALSELTKFREIIEMKRLSTSELMDRYVLRAALHGLTEAISQRAQLEEGIKSSESVLYLVTKFLYSGSAQKIVTSSDARIFSLGTGMDLSHAVNNLMMFRAGSEEEEGEGSSLSKRKTLVLLDPQAKDRVGLKNFLDSRGVDVESPNVRSSIDALHLLEYFALTYGRDEFGEKLGVLKANYPSQVDEAIGLARVISTLLEGDFERDLCNLVLERVTAPPRSIADYVEG